MTTSTPSLAEVTEQFEIATAQLRTLSETAQAQREGEIKQAVDEVNKRVATIEEQ